MKFSTIALSSCSGCHIALVNLGVDLLWILANGELSFSPVLTDAKKISECDVALIEGSVRNNEDLEKLCEMRAKSKTLIALGTCAAFGGVPGLGAAYSTLDLIARAYAEEFAPQDMPVLEDRVLPIDHYVQVDYYLPGCPPPQSILKTTLEKLIAGEKPPRVDLPVCAECRRVVTQQAQVEIKRTVNTIPEPEICLLSQGYVCMGSVSRAGCNAPCTRAGVPCMGCRGPIDRVFTERTHGILHDLTRRISHYTGKSEKEIEKKMPDMLHTLYTFTLAVPEMRRKDSENVRNLIHRIHV